MKTFWHFGDSWGTCDYNETIFSHYIAEHFGYKFQYHCGGGLSNYSILSRILSNVDKIKKNDIILCNWTFKSRFDSIHIDKETNQRYIIPSCGWFDQPSDINPSEHMKWMLDGGIDYSEEEYYKFSLITRELLHSFFRMGITIFNVFLDPPLSWQPKFPTYTIEFDNVGRYDVWCVKKGWGKEQSTHYTWGIQEELSKYYIDHMSKLHPSLTSTTTDH